MAEKVWPKDVLGNTIREGKLVRLKLDEAAAMFFVNKVEPATFLHTPEGVMPCNGSIDFVLQFHIPFAPDQNQMFKALVVEQPKPENISDGVQ
jgi:hypothetical protein